MTKIDCNTIAIDAGDDVDVKVEDLEALLKALKYDEDEAQDLFHGLVCVLLNVLLGLRDHVADRLEDGDKKTATQR